MDFIVREGDVLCTPSLTLCHVIQSIDSKTVTIRRKVDGKLGEPQEVSKAKVYDALRFGTLMVLERASA